MVKNLFALKMFLVMMFSIGYHQANAQFTVSGRITDEQKQPIEYAEVSIKNVNDSTKMTITLTDKTGNFSFSVPKGAYLLSVDYLGQTLLKKNMSVIGNINLGTLKVNTANQIGEVTVTGKKPLIERKIDRLVFNVENSVVASGYDAMEVLRYTPKIDPTEEGLKMIGRSSLAVMVNNRLINLSGKDLQVYLKSIRSENISKVEVITNPPARFDAQGNSGLINIILKKPKNTGFDGSLTATYLQRSYPGFMPSTYLNYATSKLLAAFNFYVDNEIKKYSTETDFLYASGYKRHSISKRKEKNKGVSSGLNLQYQLTKKQKTGIILNSNSWTTNEEIHNRIKYRNSMSTKVDSTLVTPSVGLNKNHYLSASAYYDINFDSIGSKLKFNYNYLRKGNDNNGKISSTVYKPDLSKALNMNSAINRSKANYNVNSFNFDIILPINGSELGMGGKATFIKNNSNIDYFNTSSGEAILDKSRSDRFKYSEKILALYSSFKKSFGEKISLLLGLRYENTRTKGNSITSSSKYNNGFNNLFPSATLSYEPNDNHSFSIGYSKRIDRPGFSEVNPFRTYTDFFSFESGNPKLLPSITHNIDFSYIFNNNLEVEVYYSLLKDGADFITLSTPNSNTVISRPENFYNQHTLGLDVYHNWNPIKWFNSNNGFNVYYNNSDSNFSNITIPNLEGYGYYIFTRNTFTLNSSKRNALYINFFQNFPSVDGLSKVFNKAGLQIGARFYFFEKKLQLSISAHDIFRQNRNRVKETYTYYNFNSNIYNDMRHLNISLNYKFGNQKSKSPSRKVDDSEKDRM